MKLPLWILGLTVAISPLTADARELTVGPGGYATIQAAVIAAGPGDTVIVNGAGERRESVVLRNKNGEIGRPLIIDGHGVTLDGSEPLRPEEWEKTESGLYRSTALPLRLSLADSMLGRFFFVFDGKIQRMGRVSKGKTAPFKPPAELAENEWTYVAAEKAFYLRRRAGLASVQAPERSNGIAFSGDCRNITVRNFKVRHFWNDGFNIHGVSRNLTFESIEATECGDDGISAHEDCEIKVKGFIANGNATGICHVGESRSETQDFQLDGNLAYGIYLLDKSRHSIKSGKVLSSTGTAVRVTRGAEAAMEGVEIIGAGPGQPEVVVEPGATLTREKVTIVPFKLEAVPATGEAFRAGDVLTVKSGPYRLEFTQQAAWTIKQLFYGEKRLLSHTGAFQTVVKLKRPAGKPDMDPWIGTGHGKEVIESIYIEADGKRYELNDGFKAPGQKFVLVKQSRLGPYRHLARVTLDGQGIAENFTYEVVEDDSQVESMYAFMHCFPKSMERWLALFPDETLTEGAFKTDNSFSLKRDILGAALFSPADGLVLALRYPEAYHGTKELSNGFWNRPGDNKLYFRPELPRGLGTKFNFSLTLSASLADGENWRQVARDTLAPK